MMLQYDAFDFDFDTFVTPLISLLVLFVLMIIMVALYVKVRVFLIILIVFLFSLVLGSMSLNQGDLPFTPYFQMFFLLFQTMIFMLTTLSVFKKRWKPENISR